MKRIKLWLVPLLIICFIAVSSGSSLAWFDETHPYQMKWDKNQISKKIWPLIFTETLQILQPFKFNILILVESR